MSYDLYLIPPIEGQDSLSTARSYLEHEEEWIGPGPPVGEKEVRKERRAQALMQANPELKRFRMAFNKIAAMEGLTQDEARAKYRHIELNCPDAKAGTQITLYDDTAYISIPYWHEPDAAGIAFRQIWQYLSILYAMVAS